MTRLRAALFAVFVVGSVLAGAAIGIGASDSPTDPQVHVTVDGSDTADGERHETNADDRVTIDAEIGAEAPTDATLDEIVLRVNGERRDSWSVNGTSATRSSRPDFDQGNNTVRVIVTDSAENVNATRFTVYRDGISPHVFLTEPYQTNPWQDIVDGNVTGTDQTLAGQILDDSAVDRITVTHFYDEYRNTTMISDPGDEFSVSLDLGYLRADNLTNRVRIDAVDEFGNTRTYVFSLNVTDGAAPNVSLAPIPDETATNRVFVAGTVTDDVWIESANVSVEQVGGNETDFASIVGPRSYDYAVDGRSEAFNESIHLLYTGTYEVTVNATDVTGTSTTETVTVDRVPYQEDDLRPTVAIDDDRTVVTDEETLFLSGVAFEGVTRRLVVETRDPTGDTLDYQVLHSGGDSDRVTFDREVAIRNDTTEVIVRATDPRDNEVTERFYVDGSTLETFVGNDTGSDTDSEGGGPDWPVVSVTPLEDERPGTASSNIRIRRASAGEAVSLPSDSDSNPVAGTWNVTLDRMDLTPATATNLTGTVAVRDRTAGALRGPGDVTPAATVSIQHSVPGDRVDELTLSLTADGDYLDAVGLDPENLTVYRQSGGEWTTLSTTFLGSSNGSARYSAQSPGLSLFALAPADAPVADGNDTDGDVTGNETAPGGNATGEETGNATDPGSDGARNETANGTAPDPDGAEVESRIVVSNVTVNRTVVGVNETVLVNATLLNHGDAGGEYTAELQTIEGLNRTAAGTQSVTVPPGESETAQFETQFAKPGNHTVSVDGSQAGPVVVERGGGLLSILSVVPLRLLGMIVGAGVGLLIVLTLVRFVLRRVGDGGEEASG